VRAARLLGADHLATGRPQRDMLDFKILIESEARS
jgi:hypothetical protein